MIKTIIRKLSLLLLPVFTLTAFAAQNTVQLPDGSAFNSEYYAAQNSDVVDAVGGDASALADHYWYHGIQEGRKPYEGAKDVSASSVLALVNEYRAQNGLSAYAYDPTLQQAAQDRARELADSQFFGHTRPTDGSRWQTILGSNLKSYKIVGENLGRGQSSAASVIYAWKQSSSHNALLLHTAFSRAGVGVAKDMSGRFYFVLIVGN